MPSHVTLDESETLTRVAKMKKNVLNEIPMRENKHQW